MREPATETPGTRPPHHPGAAPRLDAHHYAQIASSGRALGKARKADRIAGFSGVTTFLGGLAFLPFSLGSGIGMALGVALMVVGWRELSLRKDIRALDPLGFGRLARNQVALASVISAYGIAKLLAPVPTVQGLDSPGLEALGTDFTETAQRITTLTHYGVGIGIVVIAWMVQGAQALYYAKVGSSIRQAHARFPVWVMRVHAAAWGGRVPVPGGTVAYPDPLGPDAQPLVSDPAFLGKDFPESRESAA